MPELPEVQTTANELDRVLPGKKINDVWSGYDSPSYKGKEQIKDRKYFNSFRKTIIGKKFLSVERRGKNVLLNLSGGKTIVIHMKMTGHLLFGKYRKAGASSKLKVKSTKNISEKWGGEEWLPDEPETSPLWDPWNRHARLVFVLSNNNHLVLSDARKFAKVFVADTDQLENIPEIGNLGPNPLEISFKKFLERINVRQSGKVKSVLMDQSVLAGVGNIYSDELLWKAAVHPTSSIKAIPEKKWCDIYKAMQEVLKKGIKLKEDSTSDYRNPSGKRGEFQHKHCVYKRKGEPCLKEDGGEIKAIKVGGRTANFCPAHQKKYV